MCGIFGFSGPAVQPITLERSAFEAARRGPHSWGIAWTDERRRVVRGSGRITESPEALVPCHQARALIGHCRLATSGDYRNLADAQPMLVADVALVHNGIVRDSAERAAQAGIRLRTGCDSELLAAVVARMRGSAGTRLAEALRGCLNPGEPFAVLALIGDRLVGARSGLPLYYATSAHGSYFCSLASGLIGARDLGEGVIVGLGGVSRRRRRATRPRPVG